MNHSQAPWTLTARWVFPVDRPPLERGLVTIQDDKIVAVEAHGTRQADVDLGNAAILPGLVNAHTHLDLSGLRGKCPPTPDFTQWLRGVIRHRRGQTLEQTRADIRCGLAETMRAGTTLVGDIAAQGISWYPLADTDLRAVVFFEMLGLPHLRAALVWEEAKTWLATHTNTATCRPGLSPHAPYSVRFSMFAAAALAGVAVAIHLAESADELQLLMLRQGPFVSFLKELNVWEPEGLAGDPEEVLGSLNGLRPALIVHGNYLRDGCRMPRNGHIIYCPRTHAAFGHSPHPFREFLARGVRVALGTDSLASNPDLDILAEARFVHGKHGDVPGATLLRMITLSGAEALGWADETGSLTPGKSADLVVLPLPDEKRSDPHVLFLESGRPVARTLFRGAWRE